MSSTPLPYTAMDPKPKTEFDLVTESFMYSLMDDDNTFREKLDRDKYINRIRKESVEVDLRFDGFSYGTNMYAKHENRLRQQEQQQEPMVIDKPQEVIYIDTKPLDKGRNKSKKKKLSKNIRQLVWNTYIGEDIIKHKCLCCKKRTINNLNFHDGHVQAESKGGTDHISNLRPICAECNQGMGSENMIDYVVRHGLFIG